MPPAPPPADAPLALAGIHEALEVGGRLDLAVFEGDGEWVSDDDLPGRFFALWRPEALEDAVAGAGFEAVETARHRGRPRQITLRATRARTLPDYVGPGMRLLVCGLNPSLYAADAGVGFARPGNRFWPALRAAGLATADRDPRDLLVRHGIGMTDLVKRATARADELGAAEYRSGLARVTRLCRHLAPRALVVVGLTGWRLAVDRRAVAGWQRDPLGGVPVYLMPNTSGLNAHTTLEDFTAHLQAAAR